jgi:hypothetical protein
MLPGSKRRRHPKKDVERALKEAEAVGWSVQAKRKTGHAWGTMTCPATRWERCVFSVYSTPRSPGDHAKDIRRAVLRCPHRSDRE